MLQTLYADTLPVGLSYKFMSVSEFYTLTTPEFEAYFQKAVEKIDDWDLSSLADWDTFLDDTDMGDIFCHVGELI